MSEPKSRARRITAVAPGILHWSVIDDRINFRSDAYAVKNVGQSVLIDPLPLVEGAFNRLGKVEAICLTGSCHQRSAWRYRRRFGVKVYAPKGAEGLEERPDKWYCEGEQLPGGLKAIHAPGPTEIHYAFHLPSGRGALFCADIVMRQGKTLSFVPDEYQDDPQRTRRTAKWLLGLRFAILCLNHGAPLKQSPKLAIRKALEGDKAE